MTPTEGGRECECDCPPFIVWLTFGMVVFLLLRSLT